MIEPEQSAVAACSACRLIRPHAELLRVTETGGLHRSKFVCRPNVAPGCFGSVGPRDVERIETAIPEAPLLPRPPVPRPVVRPAPAPVQPFRPGRLVATDATGNGGPW